MDQELFDNQMLIFKAKADDIKRLLNEHKAAALDAIEILEIDFDEEPEEEQKTENSHMHPNEDDPFSVLSKYVFDMKKLQEYNRRMVSEILICLERHERGLNNEEVIMTRLRQETDRPPTAKEYFRNILRTYMQNDEHFNDMVSLVKNMNVVEQNEKDELENQDDEENKKNEDEEEVAKENIKLEEVVNMEDERDEEMEEDVDEEDL